MFLEIFEQLFGQGQAQNDLRQLEGVELQKTKTEVQQGGYRVVFCTQKAQHDAERPALEPLG